MKSAALNRFTAFSLSFLLVQTCTFSQTIPLNSVKKAVSVHDKSSVSRTSKKVTEKGSFIADKLNNLAKLSFGPGATVAIDVRKVTDGQTVYSLNSRKTLVAASVQKCVTAICALETLGENRRFETGLWTSVKPEGKVIKGDIIIHGSGDPSLGCDYFTDDCKALSIINKWVQKIKSLGITTVRGNIIGDGGTFKDQPLSRYAIWEDVGNYYGAVTSGLSFMGNQYFLHLSSPARPGSMVKVLYTEPPFTAITSWDNHLRSGKPGSGDNAYIFGTPWSAIRLLTGTIPPGRKDFAIKGSLPNPAYTCAAMLHKALRKQGIDVKGDAIGTNRGVKPHLVTAIGKHASPPLSQLIKRMNKHSDNVFAEQIFLLTALHRSGNASWKTGIKAVTTILTKRGISLNGVSIKDGSGLSRYNGLTAQFLTDCFLMASRRPWFKTFFNSLPVSGTDGSLKNRFNSPSLIHNVYAKTGTMERVHAIGGYIRCCSGQLAAVTFIVNNGNLSYSQTMKVFSQMLNLIRQK